MSLKSPLSLAIANDITSFPRELHLNILTFLRATDLSALQRTTRCFNNRDLIVAVVDHCANVVYPSDLTKGFDTPIISGEVRSVAVVAKKGNHKKVQPTLPSPATSAEAIPTPEKLYTYEMLRNMEMLVVARVLSRPEPPLHERDTCFYVSKSWCRAALRWLEVQEEEWKEQEERRRAVAEEAKLAAQAQAAMMCTPKKGRGNKHGGNNNRKSPHPGSSGKKKKLSRKEQRQRERRMSDAMPPWSNINNDIVCEHGSVKQCSSKSARARRRVMDKQAWKVLKRLYPESVQLEASSISNSVGNNNNNSTSINAGGCLLCAAETETAKKAELDRKEEEKANRKKPLGCPLVRGFYTRGSKGYPLGSCVVPPDMSSTATAARCCPLKPGVYCALPRSWCHRWRKYIKTGEGGLPPAPDASEVLCDAHNLPLVPPHVESFLCGETLTLLGSNHAVSSTTAAAAANMEDSVVSMAAAALSRNGLARANADAETLQALRAAGISEAELHAQRVAMAGIEEDMRHFSIGDIGAGIHESTATGGGDLQQDRVVTNEQLDRENRVVVEILTEDEATALEKWWPRCHVGTYALKFAVVQEDSSRNGKNNNSGGGTEILWSAMPCRECDPSSRSTTNFVVRNRLQKRGYR